MAKDISENLPIDLATAQQEVSFSLSDAAYDLVIDDIPFIINASNQNPYRRETAQYKKDQFDNTVDPGEQSLSGWWLRSQSSFHNGAGINFYEPGSDYQHVSHRFHDSRGVDVWTIGEAKLLPEVVDVYTGTNLINAAKGNTGSTDCLVIGNGSGILKQIIFDGDNQANDTNNYVASGTSYPSGHNGSNFPFYSLTSDGIHYYAVCSTCVHSGTVGTLDSDVVKYKHNTAGVSNVFIKYVKGYVLLGTGKTLTNLHDIATATTTHSAGSANIPTSTYYKSHLNDNWTWNDATAGSTAIYVSGYAGNTSEIWSIGFDETANTLNMAGSKMVISLPVGELVNSLQFYLGYLAVGTTKGIRICPVDINGNVSLGPLLYENHLYAINGFAVRDNYLYGATQVANDDGTYTHGCLIRIDLGNSFDDGSFAYAYDIEYQSSVNETYSVVTKALTSNVATLTTTTPHDFNVGNTVTITGVDATFNGTYDVTAVTSTTFSYAKTASNVSSTSVSPFGSVSETSSNSQATEVYEVNGRLVMVIEETTSVLGAPPTGSGELHIESESVIRESGWLQTGKIRYNTIEPKFFKYINLHCTTGEQDSITIDVIDDKDVRTTLVEVSEGLSNKDLAISNPVTSQVTMAFRFTLNNKTADVDVPVLKSYQIKSLPAIRRQRLIQYPLNCFDIEMDRYNSVYGYLGRAIENINRLEAIEETGKFVTVTDYRTGESYEGVIEEVKFANETSADKNNNGFGGLLTITVRKM